MYIDEVQCNSLHGCFFNDTATTEIYTLSLHDALPISCTGTRPSPARESPPRPSTSAACQATPRVEPSTSSPTTSSARSEEHTSELQSRQYLVCRFLLEKK